MTELVATVDVERPLETVWDYLTDLHRAKDWSIGVIDTAYFGRISLGATGVDTRRIGKNETEVNWEVTGYNPPTLLVLTYGAPLNAMARFSLRPTPTGGTRLSNRTTVKRNGWMSLISPFIDAEAQRDHEKQLARAKRNLENRQARQFRERRTTSYLGSPARLRRAGISSAELRLGDRPPRIMGRGRFASESPSWPQAQLPGQFDGAQDV